MICWVWSPHPFPTGHWFIKNSHWQPWTLISFSIQYLGLSELSEIKNISFLLDDDDNVRMFLILWILNWGRNRFSISDVHMNWSFSISFQDKHVSFSCLFQINSEKGLGSIRHPSPQQVTIVNCQYSQYSKTMISADPKNLSKSVFFLTCFNFFAKTDVKNVSIHDLF